MKAFRCKGYDVQQKLKIFGLRANMLPHKETYSKIVHICKNVHPGGNLALQMEMSPQ